jgi:hypothetical protein
MAVARICAIPLPDGLADTEAAEYEAFQAAMGEIEGEVDLLRRGEHADQIAARRLLEGVREQGRAQADEQLRLRLEMIDEQIKTERARIESEFEEARRALHQRILRTYCQIDVALNRQLKELMGKDYAAYIAANAIDFPRMPPETQMRTRLHEPEEAKIRLASAEVERDIRRVQQKYGVPRDSA